jgi:hypothetical protein
MFSGERDLSHWHDASARASGSHATAESRGAKYAGGNNPAINNADAARNRAAQAIADRLDAPNACIRGNDWIIKIHHHHAVIGNAVREESLHAAVGPNAAMSIEVVDGHVREHANVDG